MSNGNKSKGADKPSSPTPSSSSVKPAPFKIGDPKGSIMPVVVPNLFRRWDWIAFWITAVVIFAGYFYTLAPDVTLEDSGELATASYYAGVPHPPGYPVWTVYTWLFTVLFPFKNVAWRVSLSSAVAGAISCGMLGLIVSRCSSMMIEGIAELRNLDKKFEAALCVV